MITLQAVCDYTDDLLSAEHARDYCPNGLQVEGKEGIKTIATAVSSSLEAIEAAAKSGADLLLVHHGLFWKNIEPRVCGALKTKIELLLSQGISLLAYHLPLDRHEKFGNNWRAAQELGWSDMKDFCDYGVEAACAPISPAAFKEKLETYYGHTAHHAPGSAGEIRRVALISGGAHWNLKEAIEEGFDAFVTGSFDEPMWSMARESKTHFFALGHSATEEIGVRALGGHLAEKFGIQHTHLPSDNPF